MLRWLEWGIIFGSIFLSTSECPRECECKWRSGKESVLCSNKNLTAIPTNLDPGTQLLDLTGNNLSSIRKDEFSSADLLNLQRIFLSRCSLRIIHKFAFRNLSNLVDLELSYNLLATIPSHALSSTPELRELKLNGNPIDKVLNNSFRAVPRLTKLDLSECRIVFLDLEAFSGLETSLEWLKLDKNRLISLRAPCLTRLKNLHGLELSGNPWHCLCALRPLREWIIQYNIPHTVSPTCATPERLAARSWDRLHLDEFACTPRVAALETSTNGEEGTNITLSCIIRSVPTATVRWFRKNQLIPGNSHGRLQIDGSNLTITSAEISDTGAYTCAAENKAGKAEARIQLQISLKPLQKQWSAKIVFATVVVIVLFSIAGALLVLCICSLRKRRNFPVQNEADGYEMNHKADYQKVHRETANVSELNMRNGRYMGRESNMPANQMWSPKVDDAPNRTERISPDLHIPRLHNLRTQEAAAVRELGVISTENRLPKTIYPDLLESDKNTLPRSRNAGKRTRTGSFGSESLSPLLQGSSDESCDIPETHLSREYPSAELERFLAEYRSLQEQLHKMKESCENLREENLRCSKEPATISGLMDDPSRSAVIREPCYGVCSPSVDPLQYSVSQRFISENRRNGTFLNAKEDFGDKRVPGLSNDAFWLTRNRILNSSFLDS